MDSTFQSRSLPADLDVDPDAGTAEGIVVPFDQETPIIEAREHGPIQYVEVFRQGSCDRAVRGGAGRITLTYNHSESFGDRLGVATRLESRPEGLWALFRFDASKAAAARDACSSSHRGLSVGFVSIIPRAFTEKDGSLVERRSVHLLHVAAVPEPAYAGAGLTVVRNRLEDGPPTDAEEAYATEAQARQAALDSALALVEAGRRWDQFRA